MTAAMPSSISLPIHAPGRPGHRRSYTTNSGPGAFASLGALPRRRQQHKTVFSLNGDDDDDDSQDDLNDNDDEDVLDNIPPALRLRPNSSLRITISSAPDDDDPTFLRTKATDSVPFPRSSPLSTTPAVPLPPAGLAPPKPTRPSVTRTTSTPILLSNGKPLKPSLKSSSSSPHIPIAPLQQPPNHLRARSEPSTPNLGNHPVPKNVHFPTNEEGGLATIRVFNRSAKPANLLRQSGEDTETETEGELSTGSNSGFIRGPSALFPFPRSHSPLSQHERNLHYDIDKDESSPIPAKEPTPSANVYLEALSYVPKSQPGNPQGLAGTLLVRNIAYEKQVTVRFTLDDWQTTSEVSARYAASLPSLPSSFLQEKPLTYGDTAVLSSSGVQETSNPQWDRFAFTIRLEDYAAKLAKRTMFLVVRYVANAATGPIESWDNNSGKNYKIAFREASVQTLSPAPHRGRLLAVSSPPSFAPATTSTMNITSSVTTTQPQHAQMVAQTTLLRLKKLNLRNYAAPSSTPAPTTTSSTSPTTTPGPLSNTTTTSGASVPSQSGRPSVGASVAFDGQGQGQEKNGSGRLEISSSVGMQILGGFPAHLGSPSSAVGGGGGNEKIQEAADAFGDRSGSRTPSPTVKDSTGQDYRFPGSSTSSTSSIPLLSFSSPSASSSSGESTPSVGSPQISSASVDAAATLIPISAIDIHRRPALISPLDMGTSPPFSMMADLAPSLAKRRGQRHGDHHHSQPHPGTAPSSGVSTPQALERKDEDERQHWSWVALALQDGKHHSEEEVKKVLAGIREKSTSSPVRRVSQTNSGRSSPVKSTPGRSSPVKDAAGQSSPLVKNETVDVVVSPQPRAAGHGWSKVGSGWNRGNNHPRASPIYFDTSATSSASTTPTLASRSTPASSTLPSTNHQDSVYQAFVRQWCFTQGPSPVPGNSQDALRGGVRFGHGHGGEREGRTGIAADGRLVV